MEKTFTFWVWAALLLVGSSAQAQYYQNSVGLRLGKTKGVTYKRFFSKEQAIELMASGRSDGFQVTGMFQFHRPMPVGFNENFYAYYGVGGHLGYEMRRNYFLLGNTSGPLPPEFGYEDRPYFTMGADAILGVEYRWLSVPITLSVDLKPYFDFVGMQFAETRFWDLGFSIKYVF